MPLFKCDMHGLEPAIEVCAHVAAELERGNIIPRRRFLSVEACDACVTGHELHRFPRELPLGYPTPASDAHERLHAGADFYCRECMAAIALAHARARGEPDPFPPFEHTLTFLQQDIVRELESGLLASFAFRKSIVDGRERALRVHTGALTRPLEIVIYYVTEPSRQDAILAWIAQFFAGLTRQQRRVSFYREENWHRVPASPPVLEAWSGGPEELIRQHDV